MTAKFDENRIATIQAVSSVDGNTLINVQINPVNNSIKIDDGITGTDLSTNENNLRDVNRRTGLYAEDKNGNRVELYCDENGQLLIDSVTNPLA